MGQGYTSSICMDMEVAGLPQHLHGSGQQLIPSILMKHGGNNSPRGHTKTKGGEQSPPSICTGCIWTPLASMLAMRASRHPSILVPLTDRTMSSASPSPGDMGVGTRSKPRVCAPPASELWSGQRHGSSWDEQQGWGGCRLYSTPQLLGPHQARLDLAPGREGEPPPI